MNNFFQDDDFRNAMTFIENKKPSQIYFVSDIHFYKSETANRKSDTELKMKKFLKECKKLGPNDVLIFLGDVGHVKCTLEQNNKIKNLLKNTECKKILVKGNHDCLSNDYYKECGFIYVVNYLTYKNIILTHIPVVWDRTLSPKFPINNQMCQFKDYRYPKQWVNPQVYNTNIHGHIHGSDEYWDTEKKGHYDVWKDDHRFVRLDEII